MDMDIPKLACTSSPSGPFSSSNSTPNNTDSPRKPPSPSSTPISTRQSRGRSLPAPRSSRNDGRRRLGAGTRLRHPDGLIVEYLEHRPTNDDVRKPGAEFAYSPSARSGHTPADQRVRRRLAYCDAGHGSPSDLQACDGGSLSARPIDLPGRFRGDVRIRRWASATRRAIRGKAGKSASRPRCSWHPHNRSLVTDHLPSATDRPLPLHASVALAKL